MLKYRIGLVGAGNMGASILEGVLRKKIVNRYLVMVYDKINRKSKSLARKCRVAVSRDIREICVKSDLIVLAIKPQDFAAFVAEAKGAIQKNACVMSILAGLSTQKIEGALGRVSVVRAMPNLAAKAGESMTVLCGRNRKWLRAGTELFRGCGEAAVLPEKMFDHVTAMSGSGPAYFFHLMELLEDFGVKRGMPRAVAAKLAVQTGLGAAILAKTSGIPCGELRKMVTSKKGTTEAALKMLRRKKFGKIFHLGLGAAACRSRQLRKKG